MNIRCSCERELGQGFIYYQTSTCAMRSFGSSGFSVKAQIMYETVLKMFSVLPFPIVGYFCKWLLVNLGKNSGNHYCKHLTSCCEYFHMETQPCNLWVLSLTYFKTSQQFSLETESSDPTIQCYADGPARVTKVQSGGGK